MSQPEKCWCATCTGREGSLEFIVEKLAVAINRSDRDGDWPAICRLLELIDMLVAMQQQNLDVKICDSEFMAKLTQFIRKAGAESGMTFEQRPRLN